MGQHVYALLTTAHRSPEIRAQQVIQNSLERLDKSAVKWNWKQDANNLSKILTRP